MSTEQAIQAIYEMILRIDDKVNKLSERMDKLTDEELPNITLKEFTEEYYCKQFEYRINGAERLKKLRESILNRIIAYFGDMNLQDITINDVHKWIAKIENDSRTKLKGTTIDRYCCVLRAILNKAIDFKFLHKNIVLEYKFKAKDNINQRTLTQSEVTALLTHSKDSKNKDLYLMLQLALNTGMRKGEITKLRKSDIVQHQDCTYIRIRAENSKSSKERAVPLNPNIQGILETHINRLDNNSFIFTSTSKKAFTNCRERIKSKYNIPHFRFHDLRHTFATRLIERKVQPNDVRVLLGHSTMRLTERYMHYNLENLANAVNLL